MSPIMFVYIFMSVCGLAASLVALPTLIERQRNKRK